jgi:5-deoxy-glucuronate isomerase
MTSLLIRPGSPSPDGCVIDVTPEKAGWSHVGFSLHRLADGQSIRGGQPDRETCIVVLCGTAVIAVPGTDFGPVGGRKDPFEGRAPGVVYAPAGLSFSVRALGAAEVALCSAPGRPGREARRITDADMPREVRGTGTNQRYVRNILPETMPADGLLVVEVITPAGHWSSYPPHKHDMADPGLETALEETYYHRLQPAQGFAFQRVYTDDRSLDETMCVQDGDLVMVPRGYHPVGTAHGYDLYYLNVMAGPERRWIFRNDPAHDWIARST